MNLLFLFMTLLVIFWIAVLGILVRHLVSLVLLLGPLAITKVLIVLLCQFGVLYLEVRQFLLGFDLLLF